MNYQGMQRYNFFSKPPNFHSLRVLFKVLKRAKHVQTLRPLTSNPLIFTQIKLYLSRLGGVWSPVRVWSPRHGFTAMCERVRAFMDYFLRVKILVKSVYKCL